MQKKRNYDKKIESSSIKVHGDVFFIDIVITGKPLRPPPPGTEKREDPPNHQYS